MSNIGVSITVLWHEHLNGTQLSTSGFILQTAQDLGFILQKKKRNCIKPVTQLVVTSMATFFSKKTRVTIKLYSR